MNAFTLIGGPTALFEYGSLRWLTDPAFSPPGEYEGGLVKLTGPALDPDVIGAVDVVLLSHDHHSDNLDPAGRSFLPRAQRVLTTDAGAQRLGGNATGLHAWSSVDVHNGEGTPVTVTAVPAQHGPDGTDHITGPVIGFVLSAPGTGGVYVSGDNASLDVVREIAARIGQIDVAILFAGAVQLGHRFDGAYLTLSSDRAAEAAKILGARLVIPVHFEGWKHFTQGADALRAAFAGNQVSDRLRVPERGRPLVVAD
jgi:L-ascorbate metabolism protein UlaG (beta-lactamase superfamily)